MNNKIIILVGPSGSGKSTLEKFLKDSYNVNPLVSTTSRAPRAGEIDGVHYHFKTPEEFEQMIKEDTFVEHTQYVSNYYGVTKAEIASKRDKDIVCTLDRNGALVLKELFRDDTEIIFIKTSVQNLEARMIQRGDSPQAIVDKLANIQKTNELANEDIADWLVSNDKELGDTKSQLQEIMFSIFLDAHLNQEESNYEKKRH